ERNGRNPVQDKSTAPIQSNDERNGALGRSYGYQQMNGLNGTAKPVIPTGPKALRKPGEIPTGPAAMRSNQPARAPKNDMLPPPTPSFNDSLFNGPSSSSSAADKRPAAEDAEAALIRQRYMGADTNTSTFSAKKKRRRTTQRKFNFEWNAEEDTSPDYNPIYASRAEAGFFGR